MSEDEGNKREGRNQTEDDKPDETASLLNTDESSAAKKVVEPSNIAASFRNRGNQRWLKLRTTVQLSNALSSSTHKKPPLKREDSFLKRFSTRQIVESQEYEDGEYETGRYLRGKNGRNLCSNSFLTTVINPDESFYFFWLTVITTCILYNYWTLIVRQAFPELQATWLPMWFTLDGFADSVFILDIVVQFRTGYLEQGLMVYDYKKLAMHYIKSRPFIMDLISLTPTDILQAFIGIKPMIRFPRYVKMYRSYHFYYMVESRTLYPNLWRVMNLIHVLLLLAHWFGCFYYMLSEAEQFQGDWVYPYPEGDFATLTRKYLGSVYWATLTLTTIGDLPTPHSNVHQATATTGTTVSSQFGRSRKNFKSRIMYQSTNIGYVFTIVSYLIGVFIFATIVGQVGNVITNRNASRLEFERLLDSAKLYMRHHRVPRDMQRRVQRWYDYSWSRGRMRGGGDINSALGHLPDKLKTELALHVNLKTLKKVSIFKECQPEFLHDLVLKMKAYIFTPGDLICRKGEVAREMFIIADGILEVISDNGKVLTQMKAGDFFGEIGILNIGGFNNNRRTADVRSVGYSELFSLAREDVKAAMKDFPEAEDILMTMGKKRLLEAKLSGNVSNMTNDKEDGNVASGRGSDPNSSRYRHRSMMKKIKQDVSGIKYYFSKSRDSINHGGGGGGGGGGEQRFDMCPQQTEEESTSDVNRDSVRGILRKLTKQSTSKVKDLRTASCIKNPVSRDSEKRNRASSPTRYNIIPVVPSTERSTYSRGSSLLDVDGTYLHKRGDSNGGEEMVGAGLPLIQRLLLLKKMENEKKSTEKVQNNVEGTDVSPREEDNTGATVKMTFIERLKLIKKQEEEANSRETVSRNTSEEKPVGNDEPINEVLGAGLPLFQRLKLLKKKEEESNMKEANKSASSSESNIKGSSQETAPESSTCQESEEPLGAGLPLIQRLKLLKDEKRKKEESNNIKITETQQSKTDKNSEFAERTFSKGLAPETSLTSLRRLSTLLELGMGQSSAADGNGNDNSDSENKKDDDDDVDTSANTICDKTEEIDTNTLLSDATTEPSSVLHSNDCCNSELSIQNNKSNFDNSTQLNVDEFQQNSANDNNILSGNNNKTENDVETTTAVHLANTCYENVANPEYAGTVDSDLHGSDYPCSSDGSVLHKRGILKSPGSAENSNNDDTSTKHRLARSNTIDGYAERRKRLQKSVAFCDESPESPSNNCEHIPTQSETSSVKYQKKTNMILPVSSNDLISDSVNKPSSNIFGSQDDKMVQVISTLHSLIKVQMDTIQEKLLNRIQELETEMKRKDTVIESLVMKMNGAEIIETNIEDEGQEQVTETEDSSDNDSNNELAESNTNEVDKLVFEELTKNWDDPHAFDQASLMRLEFPTMSESNSLSESSLNSNKSIDYVTNDGDSGHRRFNIFNSSKKLPRKRNPLFRHQSLSMYPETTFITVDERQTIGASVPELSIEKSHIWDADHKKFEVGFCSTEIP